MINEAEYKGKEVELNQPQRGGSKKYFVYVKDPETKNVKKVNFGDKNMEIKRDDPERKKAFRARHNCSDKKDKTSAGYWSCKFWSDTPVSDLLNEIADVDTIDVEDFKKKDELHPEIWDNASMKMIKDIRKALLKVTKEFIQYAGLEDFKFSDVTLTGSLANYNYSQESDLDVHILMDYSQISDDEELVRDYLKNKRTLWNESLPITVKGHEVEMYVQDTNEPHTSTGVYSLVDNEWKTKPIKEMIQLDTNNIKHKASEMMDTIDDLMDSEHTTSTINQIERLFNKIKSMRKAGLDKEGEFSVENIVFKILRRTGYIEKLLTLKKDLITKNLTVENNG